jgi:ABC-type branched-subunit amino acid transport system ATPase component
MLRVDGISKRFGGLQAVSKVSLEVPMGKIVALLGPNGAGKTTTFNLISGLIKPDSGKVTLFDRNITALPPNEICRAGIARTFQICQLFATMTVEENVMAAALYGSQGGAPAIGEARQRTGAMLKQLGLGRKRALLPKDLTFAEQRHVEIARALVMRPRILLLDEVMAGLTATEIGEAIELLEQVRSPEIGILLVEHQMRAVMRLADSIVVMVSGRNLVSGSPAEIRVHPEVLAAYLGEEIDESGSHALTATTRTVTPGAAAVASAQAPEPAPILEVEGIDAGYGALIAARDVSLRVGRNEVVALIGSNGMGKSTTLKAISGIIKVRSGRIRFNGKDIHRLPTHEIVRLGLGQVPEGRQLFPYMSVEDNLTLGAAFLPDAWTRRAETLAEVFRLFPRLQERRRQRAGSLSGGEQQMVAIGRALMGRPKLLMLDEPSIGLAPIVVAETFEAISQIAMLGISVLIVEQNVASALQIAHRVYVMETGRIVIEDDAGDLIANPEFLATFGLGHAA